MTENVVLFKVKVIVENCEQKSFSSKKMAFFKMTHSLPMHCLLPGLGLVSISVGIHSVQKLRLQLNKPCGFLDDEFLK